ncbi:hypothetical protein [Sandaracinus amylolyticus]|uniref:hypothetical protein n=1 Tax=Sandaracinus amylolyticus TaxID=927083 RepID=UPI001F1B8793|nr:hypothetical protein [Sandaracinus amylolyticus]
MVTLLVVGCEGGATSEPLAVAAPEHASADTRRAHMHERFESIDVARSALQRGDLAATRTIASTIAFRMPIDLPPPVRVHGDAVPRRALALSAAEDLDTASAAFAQLVGTCGACHEAAGATWAWQETPIPEGEDLEPRMQRHAWANERMWEALLTRDPERFDRAASVLAEAPLSGDIAPDEERPAGLREIEERLRDAARDVASATTMDERVTIYGRIVATCGACHARLRAAP